MFEVPEWAECSVGDVSELPRCSRSVTKMVSVLRQLEDGSPHFESLGVCNRHVEVAEAAMAEVGDELPPIAVPRREFPDFVAEILGGSGLV